MEQIVFDVDSKFNKILIHQEEFSTKVKHLPSLGIDHPSVKKVIQVAIELTKENRLITTELLYNMARKELKISGVGLDEIIQMLISKRFLIDRSRFIKTTLLNNKTRSYIYHLIKNYKGIHFSLLKKKISKYNKKKIGIGHLRWHLDKLIRFNLIKKVKIKNYLIFLPVEISDEEGIFYFILRDTLNRLMVNFLLENESVYKTEFYKELNVKRTKTYYRIKNLIELGILSPRTDNKVSINSDKNDLIKNIIRNILQGKR
ncbi:MAG: hypothetical protein ACFFBH_15520 [Promethearchaeota archaeon]